MIKGENMSHETKITDKRLKVEHRWTNGFDFYGLGTWRDGEPFIFCIEEENIFGIDEWGDVAEAMMDILIENRKLKAKLDRFSGLNFWDNLREFFKNCEEDTDGENNS